MLAKNPGGRSGKRKVTADLPGDVWEIVVAEVAAMQRRCKEGEKATVTDAICKMIRHGREHCDEYSW